MAHSKAHPELIEAKVVRYLCALRRIMRQLSVRAAVVLSKCGLARPVWLRTEESCSREYRNLYGIYSEDIGPIGLRNIQIIIDRYKQRIPGSTIHVGLIGRDNGKPEKSLLVEIITSDEEAVLEMSAETRRHNGQAWVGVFKTAGTFVEIKGPKLPVVSLADDPQNAASDPKSLPEDLLAS